MSTRHFAACLVLVAGSLEASSPSAAPPAGTSSSARADLAQPRSLYLLDHTARLPVELRSGFEDAVEDALIEYQVTADPAVVATNPARIRLDLPHLGEVEALRDRFVDHGPEWKSWTGRLRHAGSQEEGSGFVYFGYHGKRVTGIIHFEGERWQILGGVDGPQRLVRESDELATTPNCALEIGTDVGFRSLADHQPSDAPSGLTTATRIDVMALYPKVYFAFPTSEISLIDYVEDSIDLANTIFVNSEVNAYYNLVHVGPIVTGQPTATSLDAGLALLDAPTSEITTLRNAFGADFVTIVVPFGWTGTDACGIANLPVLRVPGGAHNYIGPFGVLKNTVLGTRLYTAIRQGCGFGDFTLAHELGHNWGMAHETYGRFDSTPLSTYAFGYEIAALNKATAMACICPVNCNAGTAPVCNRIPYFSDPDNFYQGQATGTPDRRNAQMARARLQSYPFFFPQVTNTPPVASFTRSCNSTTRKCTFNASGTTDNGTITQYYWDFGDGISVTKTVPTVDHTYGGSGTSFWVHLIATDNGNQRDLAIDLVTF